MLEKLNIAMERTNKIDMNMMRNYSSVFSRRVFSDIINYDDYSHLNAVINLYDIANKRKVETYYDIMRYLYKSIAKYYRCEYVYKNEVINNLLLKEYSKTGTIAINEFRVLDSIVDLAMFNGVSKAFEIKTEYDTKKRLSHQLETYSRLFEECYLVIPKELLEQYKSCIGQNVGIIVLYTERGKIKLSEVRPAAKNVIDSDVLIHSIRTCEYKNIIKDHFGYLPAVSCYEMFDECKKMLKEIPTDILQKLFIAEIKKRKNISGILNNIPVEIRQMCLSLNLTEKQSKVLGTKLNIQITM